MTLSWDPHDERVVIEVFPYTEAAVDEPDSSTRTDRARAGGGAPGPARRPGRARAFVQRAAQVIEAGRPDCPFCGNPIDPEGHLCVRANGFRRRDPA